VSRLNTEEEVVEVLNMRKEVRRGAGGTNIVEGRTSEGRLLRVVYTTQEDGSTLVISAYPLNPKQAAAFRRRERKR
jgi:hypothetical protein